MDKRFWAIVGVIVVLFAGIVVASSKKDSENGTSSSKSSGATKHAEGNTKSKVTLVEYGDFQCPVCQAYFPVVQQVQEKYKDTIQFQFRNLPLSQIHPNAFAAARAAEAAALQGKFWEMHDTLYASENWSQWTPSSNALPYFKQYARNLGLNVTTFEKDFASSKVNSSVNADIAAFKETGKDMSTPSFFINGDYVPNSKFIGSTGSPTVEAFSKLLDTALKNAK